MRRRATTLDKLACMCLRPCVRPCVLVCHSLLIPHPPPPLYPSRPLLLDLGPGGSIPPQPMRSPHRKKGSPKRGHTPAYSPKAFQQFVEKGQSVFEAAYERSSASNNSIMTSRISGTNARLYFSNYFSNLGPCGQNRARPLQLWHIGARTAHARSNRIAHAAITSTDSPRIQVTRPALDRE